MRGLTFANNSPISPDTIFVSTGADNKINLWSTNKLKKQYEEFGPTSETLVGNERSLATAKNYAPRAIYMSKHALTGLDHSYSDNLFATAGAVVQLWNYERSAPLQTFEWGVDTVTKLKFNPS